MVKTDNILVKNDNKRNTKMVFVILNSRYKFSNKNHFLLNRKFFLFNKKHSVNMRIQMQVYYVAKATYLWRRVSLAKLFHS